MPRGKKKNNKAGGGKFQDDDDDDDDFVDPIAAATKKAPTPQPPAAAAAAGGGKKNKGKQPTKKNPRQQQDSDDDDDDDFVDPIKAAVQQQQDSDDDDDEGRKPPVAAAAKNNTKKKKNHKGKKGGGRFQDDDDDDDDDDSEEESDDAEALAAMISGGGKKNNKKKPNNNNAKKGGGWKQKLQAMNDSDNDDDEEEDDDDDNVPSPPPAAPSLGGKKKKKGRAAQLAAAVAKQTGDDDDDDDDEDFMEEDNDDDEEEDNEPVEQVAVMLDDWGLDDGKDKKAKKKDGKKNKKEKKEKKKDKKSKDKKKKKGDDDDSDDEEEKDEKKNASQKDAVVVPITPAATVPVVEEKEAEKLPTTTDTTPESAPPSAPTPAPTPSPPAPPPPPARPKSKFELQMEEALKKKKEEEEAAKAASSTNTNKKGKKNSLMPPTPVIPPVQDTVVDTTKTNEPAGKEDELEQEKQELVQMYGIGDGTAMGNENLNQDVGDEDGDPSAILYGPDGKKLSNKERKKMLKAKQAAEREAEFAASAAQASRDGAQFACSQTAVDDKDPQWQNSLDVQIPNFSISAAGKILFKDAALSIAHGRRYGLVGPNGKGKSTLLKMIASGDLKLPPRIDFLYVEQEIVADDTPAVEAVLRADTKRWDLMEEEQAIMKRIDAGDETAETVNRLQFIVDELTNMGADAAEAKARRILYGLGFAIDMQTKPTKMFSGGWRMRISLARALFVEPTLLMLDEPTNHLDLNAVIWLEEYLKKWKKTLFVVSHDQDFLNSVCEEILHIEDLKLISYKGNYDSFKKAERIKFEQQQKAWEKQEKRLRELKKSGQSKQKAQETLKKNATKREAGARNQKKKNQAVAAGTEAVEATELIKRPKEYQVKFEFSEVNELSRPVMEVTEVHFRYSPNHPVIFEKIDFGIDMDSRITIVGPNGAGKSTLLKLLTGEVDPTRGEVKRNPRLRMGVYNQHFVDKLPMDMTPVDFLRDRFQDEDYQSVRNRLGKYGLEGHAHEVTMRDLSGGQKARVVFVELSLQEPHILLLDEPTNNLDIESIDALCDAINAFNGGVVVVTHDQRLIDECECTLWVVEKLGVTEWTEGFEDYKASILEALEREVERENQIRQEKLQAAATVRAEKLARLVAKNKKTPAAK